MRFLLVSVMFVMLSIQAFGMFSRGGLMVSLEGGYQNLYSIGQNEKDYFPLVRVDGPAFAVNARIFMDKYSSIDLGVSFLMNVNTNDDVLIPQNILYSDGLLRYDNIVIPVSMISPVLQYTLWLDQLGIGMGAFFSFIPQEKRSYEISDGFHCGGGFVSLEYAFMIDLGIKFTISPYAMLGFHVNNIHVGNGDQLWGIGYNWAVGCKVGIPIFGE